MVWPAVSRQTPHGGAFDAKNPELGELIGFVAEGSLDLRDSVSRVYEPEQFAEALGETRDKRAGSVRVAVRYR